MMHTELAYRMLKHDRRQKLEDARQYRLLRLAQSGKPTRRMYGPLLFYIGGWMMRRGMRLQTQYGEWSASIREMRDLQRQQEKLVLSLGKHTETNSSY